VFAISNDPVPVVAEFAREHDIRYHLLSDQDSRVIRQLSLLNRHIEELQSYYGKPYIQETHGPTPYPGTFRLDEQGVIVDRRFDPSYRVRPSGTVLLADAFEGAEPKAIERAETEWGEVAVRLHSDTYHAQELLELHVAVALAEPYHAYVEPIPDGYVPLSVELTGPASLDAGAVELPKGKPWRIEGLSEEFAVVDGEVHVTLPFVIRDAEGPVTIEARVRCQVCTDNTCLPPVTLTLPLELAERPLLRP
jgi:hypothetical protein